MLNLETVKLAAASLINPIIHKGLIFVIFYIAFPHPLRGVWVNGALLSRLWRRMRTSLESDNGALGALMAHSSRRI
jgi:hypothetical protein